MNKRIKYFLAAIAAMLLIVLYKVGSVYMADSVDYTRSDWLAYSLLTPDEIKRAPPFGEIIGLRYRAADGPAPQFNQIEYKGKAKVADIERYLSSLGYHEQDDPVLGKRWILKQGNKRASVTQADNSTKLTFAD